jgi:hypothetical protein
VAEAFVGHVHRHQRPQSRKARQGGQSRVIHVLAAHRQTAQRRYRRERPESASAEVRSFVAPDVFDSLRATQRREAIVARHRALAHQHAKPWVRGDVLTALGWIAGIALGLIALSELLGKETVRRKFLAEAGEE